MIFCDGETCGKLDCRDARSISSLVIPSTEDFVTDIRHFKCKVIQLVRRQMQKEIPRWSDHMVSEGAQRVSGGHGKIFSRPKLPAIPAQNVTAFAAQETELDNVQRIPERARQTNVEYSSTSLDNETTFFQPGSNPPDQTYDWHPDSIHNDRTEHWHDWHRENNQNENRHSETNWNNRNPEMHQSDNTHDRNPQTDKNDRKPEANDNNRNPEAAQNDRSQNLNVPQTGNAPQARAGISSILHWTKKMLTINFPIYWIVIVVGILGAASLVCGILIGAVLCANGNRSFPFFLRIKSRAGHAAY